MIHECYCSITLFCYFTWSFSVLNKRSKIFRTRKNLILCGNICPVALVECHKIACLTIQIMHFGSKTNAPKDGLKIRVVALPPGPSLWTAFRAADRRRLRTWRRGIFVRPTHQYHCFLPALAKFLLWKTNSGRSEKMKRSSSAKKFQKN